MPGLPPDTWRWRSMPLTGHVLFPKQPTIFSFFPAVYVADSYNHRLKELDPATNTIRTLAGSGGAGYRDGAGTAAQLSEPGGLALGPDGKWVWSRLVGFLCSFAVAAACGCWQWSASMLVFALPRLPELHACVICVSVAACAATEAAVRRRGRYSCTAQL